MWHVPGVVRFWVKVEHVDFKGINMGATQSGKFSCGECGKSYTWKAELAGRRVKCKCGKPLTVPAQDPAAAMYEAPPEGFDDLYALAEEKVVQAAPAFVRPQAAGAAAVAGGGGGRLIPAAAAAPSPARGGGAGGKSALVGYAQLGSKKRGGGEEYVRGENVFWNPVTDLYVPAALILLGTFLSFFEIRVVLGLQSIPMAIGAVGVLTIVNVTFGFAGILIATKLLDLGLGPIPVAALKTAAAAILPAAAASLVGSLLGFFGMYIAWVISFILSLIIFINLMDMDYFETCICTTIIWVIRTWVGYAILGMIFNGVGGGGAGGVLMAAAGGSQSVAAAASSSSGQGQDPDGQESPAQRYDHHAQMLMYADRKPDAKTWAADPKHAFAKRTHDETVRIVDTLTNLGATFVIVPDPRAGKGADKDKETAEAVVFLLPTDKAARAKLFEYYGTLGKTYGIKNLKDEGQQYMSIEFDGYDEEFFKRNAADDDDDDK